MPEVGDIVKARQIGLRTNEKHIWIICPSCGKGRWIADHSLRRSTLLKRVANDGRSLVGICRPCSSKMRGEMANGWRGGRTRTVKGYILVKLQPDDFFYPMTYSGYVREHRLVMARHLGRCLQSWEVVHHINGIKDDDRARNLLVLSKQEHSPSLTVKEVQKRLREVEAELAQQRLM